MEKNQNLKKDFFHICYGLGCDKMTHLGKMNQLKDYQISRFMILGSNLTSFVKEFFHISYGLGCDEMTHLIQNEPLNRLPE